MFRNRVISEARTKARKKKRKMMKSILLYRVSSGL